MAIDTVMANRHASPHPWKSRHVSTPNGWVQNPSKSQFLKSLVNILMIMFLLNMLTGDFQTSCLLFNRNIINKCWIFEIPCVAERHSLRYAVTFFKKAPGGDLADRLDGGCSPGSEVHGYLPNLVLMGI